MNLELNIKSLSSCFPICRIKLFEDVTSNEKYGPIDRIWLSPGHVFLSVRKGRQLITFDNKTTNKTHEETVGCLDLGQLSSPILDVIADVKNPSVVFIFLQNGHVDCWKFRPDLTWSHIVTFEICDSNKAQITSMCLHPSHHALYWCEEKTAGSESQGSFCVCRKTIPEDETKLKKKDLGSTEVILNNCAQCNVFPTQMGVAIVLKNSPPLISMVMLWQPSSCSISVYAGPFQKKIEDIAVSGAIDFIKVTLKFAGVIAKVKDQHRVLQVVYDPHHMVLYIIEVNGTVRIISDKSDDNDLNLKLDVNESTAKKVISWFYHTGFIGCITNTSIKLFSLVSGKLEQQIDIKEEILGLCMNCAGFPKVGCISMSNVYIMQLSKKVQKLDIDHMIKTEDFQTSSIQLAYLEQLKSINPSRKVKQDISKLREYRKENEQQINTRLAEIVDPYLEEYWELDRMQQNLLRSKLQQTITCVCPGNIEDEVLRVLSPETSITMSARQAWLMLMADTYPNQVLAVLECQMDFDTDDISTSQIQRWQCILANDSAASPVSSDVAVPIFEHICQLLYRINPAKLMHFVKICQMINDQKVGVSAFIRKRQAIQYYDRALTSIQDLYEKNKSKEAVSAYIDILLASERANCEIHAVKFCIANGHWDMAIRQLKEHQENKVLYLQLFNLILLGFNQAKILPHYADEILKLMPGGNYYSNISCLLMSSGPLTATHNLFSRSESARPILLRKSQKQDVPS